VADKLTPERRSWNMGRIRGTDTQPEKLVRRVLHRMGYRFRIQNRRLPGKPDVVMQRYKAVIFVHGCFWHRHPGCKFSYTPKSQIDFWRRKFSDTIERDRRTEVLLRESGWNVVIVWECEAKDSALLSQRLRAKIGAPNYTRARIATEELPIAAEEPEEYSTPL
jgi:DNA mismatch endonuclease, patch repair protein